MRESKNARGRAHCSGCNALIAKAGRHTNRQRVFLAAVALENANDVSSTVAESGNIPHSL